MLCGIFLCAPSFRTGTPGGTTSLVAIPLSGEVPTSEGEPATIVGDSRKVHGTPGDDVIVAAEARKTKEVLVFGKGVTT